MDKTSLFRCFVIEGPDGSGKTTLAEKLGPHVHFGGPLTSYADYLVRMSKGFRHLSEFTIFDRHSSISELVYGIFRFERHPLVPTMEAMEILAKFEPLVIYCRPPKKHLMRSLPDSLKVPKDHKSTNQIDLVLANYEAIIDQYDTIIDLYESEMPQISVLRYDHTHDKDETMLSHIRDIAQLCAD
jgi:pantothenate kinase-related protein Tda10